MSTVHIQSLLGMQFKDYVIMAADQTNIMNMLILKDDVKKIYEISENVIIGVCGDLTQVDGLIQFVKTNVHLYKLRNGYGLSVSAVAHFVTNYMAGYLSKDVQSLTVPNAINLLIGGYDEEVGGKLYHIDCLATCINLKYGSHGYGGLICMGLLDRLYKSGKNTCSAINYENLIKDLTDTEAYEVLKKCTRVIRKRYVVNIPKFQVTIVNKSGVLNLPIII